MLYSKWDCRKHKKCKRLFRDVHSGGGSQAAGTTESIGVILMDRMKEVSSAVGTRGAFRVGLIREDLPERAGHLG